MRRYLVLAILALLTLVPLTAASADDLQSGSHVGLVVSFSPDAYIVITVPADAHGQTGLELLQASGLEMIHDSGMICKLGSVGCDYPEQSCICDAPNYWSYWLLDDSGWSYSGKGAGARILSPGEIDGWVWGSGGTTPPDIDAAAVLDADRIAPALPVTTPEGLEVAFQGDLNANATVTARVQLSGNPLSLPVERDQGWYTIDLQGLPPGRHDVSLSIDDPDGVNGMTAMTHEVFVASTARYHTLVPLVVSAVSTAGTQGLPRINHMLY